MPQSAMQRNEKNASTARRMPQPLHDAEGAETEDQVYGLVSVLYHALQGAQACDQYIADAELAGDDDLASFFMDCRDEQKERAAVAKQLLVQHAEGDVDDDDDEDDEP